MLATLDERLTDNGTVTVLSCHGGSNGVAKMISEGVGDHWVFGGVVSLTPWGMVMMHTEFSGGADGPARVGTDTFSAKWTVHGTEGKECMIGFYKGQSMGLVTQWMYPSRNGKVVRRGCHVEAARGFVSAKHASKPLPHLPVPIYPKAQGVVHEMLTAAVADGPLSGEAVVEWSPKGERSVVTVRDFDALVVTRCGD